MQQFFGTNGRFPGISPVEELRRARTGTRAGRAAEFGQFTDVDPRFQQVTPFARSLFQSQFAPLQSQFALQQLGANPFRGASEGIPATAAQQPSFFQSTPNPTFRQFLEAQTGAGGTGYAPFSHQQTGRALESLGERYFTGLPAGAMTTGGGPGESLSRTTAETPAEFETRMAGLTAEDRARQAYLASAEGDTLVRSILGAMVNRRVSPFLSGVAQDELGRRFSAFRDQDLTTPLIQAFTLDQGRFIPPVA